MFLAPKQSEMTAPFPAAGLAGDCCKRGRASSEPDQNACLLPTRSPALAEGWMGASGTWGRQGNFRKCPRHHLPSRPRQPCQLCPYEWTGLGSVCTCGGVPLWAAVATAAHSSRAGSHCPGLSCAELGKGHAHGVCVHVCIITPELVLAGPS